MAAKGSAKVVSRIRLPHKYKEWPKISESLKKFAEKRSRGVEAFEATYLELDRWSNANPPFTLLRKLLSDGSHVTEEYFCEELLPWIARKALQVEKLFGDEGIPKLSQGISGEVTLTRQQVCCIMALAFFNILEPVQGQYQQLTFWGFVGISFFASQRGKLLCLLKYFERILQAEEKDDQEFLSLCISVERRGIAKEKPDKFWGECELPLSPFNCTRQGLIEDAHEHLQVDFANEYIGGGVLQLGNVQEEIRFVINPECLVSLLFCESMLDYESILIRGAEQFSKYTGYGGRFAYAGPIVDPNPIDEEHVDGKVVAKRRISIVAIDATPYSYGGGVQFNKENVSRELNKAYCGFSFHIPGDDPEHGKMQPVATGNWGCGAFGGDKELKTLIQWMATTRAGRPVRYYSFSDRSLTAKQEEVAKCLQEHKVTVGQLYHLLIVSAGGVFEFVKEEVTKSHQ